MSFEKLENKGFAFLNCSNLKTEKRQIVIVGSARGGTSLVAGAIHHLGIFTGNKSTSPVFEDVLLSQAIESNEIEKAKKIISDYSNSHSIWAWKRPASLNYLSLIEEIMPNAFFILVFKDIFSIANRNKISMQSEIGIGMQNALKDYQKIVNFTTTSKKPMMLVSAEKALQNKEAFVKALIEVNKDIEDFSENYKKAINFITPNSREYLDATRLSKSTGNVGFISRKHIKGWAKSVHSEKSVNVCLLINGKLKVKKLADIFRQDLIKAGVSSNGECGFHIDISHITFSVNDVIEVIVEHDIKPLKNGSFLANEKPALLTI